MSNYGVLMPFALSNENSRIVSVVEVERGNECNCKCLCCHTPVTARQGQVYSWHFSHRTDDNAIDFECKFSPVTAISLILRQQLPALYGFSVGDTQYVDLTWEVDFKHFDETINLYGYNESSDVRVAFEIPFANGVGMDVERIKDNFDAILSIDTQALAHEIFPKDGELTTLTPSQIYDLFFENWDRWVTIVHAPKPVPEEPIEPESPLCRCCNENEGTMGKGLLCNACVFKHVGRTFPNLTAMVKHYRNR